MADAEKRSGRPPGSERPLGPIPRGIEVLVKKAAVDPAFRAALLEERDAAARRIGLALERAEAMMLQAAPRAQLEGIIARTRVGPDLRQVFLGSAAALMVAALGAGTAGCDWVTTGHTVERPAPTAPETPPGEAAEPAPPAEPERPTRVEPTDGARPDRPPAAPKATEEPVTTEPARPEKPPLSASGGGARPAHPPTAGRGGSRPDRPGG